MLSISKLRKAYPASIVAPGQAVASGATRLLLDGVDLTVGRGEFVAITGESGTGKSTFLNLIAGLEPIDEGLVEVDGQSLARLDDAGLARMRRHSLGFVFQAFHLLPYLTVAENVAVPLRLLGGRSIREIGQQVDQVLSTLGLASMGQAMPQTLSGGEAQRVAIARALVHSPKLILADEPTGNLDADHGATVMRLLKDRASAQRAAVVLVTHSVQAAAFADRVYVLADRRLTLQSP